MTPDALKDKGYEEDKNSATKHKREYMLPRHKFIDTESQIQKALNFDGDGVMVSSASNNVRKDKILENLLIKRESFKELMQSLDKPAYEFGG